MARSRNIKPGILKNEVLGEADPLYTILFQGLWMLADREGRLEYRPKRIKAEVFPYRPDHDIDESLGWLEANGFMVIYEVAGHQYLQVNNWKRHQTPHHKEVDSCIPPPPSQPKKSVSDLKKEEPSAVPREVREYVLKRDHARCMQCSSTNDLTLDHILPQSMHGLHVPGNLRVLCRACNASRPVDGSDLSRMGTSKEEMMAICLKEYEEIQLHGHACSVHEQGQSNNGHTRPKEIASSPLIPDSLIPDTGFSDSKTSCAEPDGSPPPAEPKAVYSLPTNKHNTEGEEFHVTGSMFDKFCELYPAVDVLQAFRAMEGWLLAEPSRRKTLGGMNKFINNWLSKDQNRGGNHGKPNNPGGGTNPPKQTAAQRIAARRLELAAGSPPVGDLAAHDRDVWPPVDEPAGRGAERHLASGSS